MCVWIDVWMAVDVPLVHCWHRALYTSTEEHGCAVRLLKHWSSIVPSDATIDRYNNDVHSTSASVCSAIIVTQPLQCLTWLSWWMETQCQVVTIPLTMQLTWADSTCRLLPSTLNVTICYYYSFYCPTLEGRLSRPRHCSGGMLAMLMAV